jgi:acyl-CoA thioester hydrolase
MQVVYYANYFVYFERSRTDMLRDLGVSYREMEERGFILPVAEAHCKYKNPARYDDLLTFRSWVSEMRGVQLTVTTEVWREETLLVSGEVKLACVNREYKLTRLPDFFVEACKKVMENPEGGKV